MKPVLDYEQPKQEPPWWHDLLLGLVVAVVLMVAVGYFFSGFQF